MTTRAPGAGQTGGMAPEDRTDDVAERPDAGSPGPGDEPFEEPGEGPGEATVFVGHPAKIMRIGTMIKQLLEEVRGAPLDEAARERLAEVHDRSLRELEDGLAPELVDELRRITLPFTDDTTPTDAELRIAQAQLVGWLEGLFHGLQTALVAQQMTTQAQLAQMRRALPQGVVPPGLNVPRAAADQDDLGPGQYL